MIISRPRRYRTPTWRVFLALICLLADLSILHAQAFFDSPAQLAPKTRAALEPADQTYLASLDPIKVAITRTNFAPYQSIDGDGRIGGYAIDFLTLLAGSLGIELEPVVFASWSEMLEGMRNRQADLVPYIGYTPERARYLAFTRGVMPKRAGIVGRNGDERLADNPSLAGFRVAVGRNFVAERYLRLRHPEAVPVLVESEVAGIIMVHDREVDFFYGDLLSAFGGLPDEVINGVEVLQNVYYATGWNHLAVRSDWPQLQRILNMTIGGQRELLNAASGVPSDIVEDPFAQPPDFTAEEQQIIDNTHLLTLGALSQFDPLNGLTDEGVHTGLGSEIMSFVSARLGIPVETIGFDSPGSMLLALGNTGIDAVPVMTITPQRQAQFGLTRPYSHQPYFLIASYDSPFYWGLGSLAGKRLALASGHPLLPMIGRLYPDVEVVETYDGKEALQMVSDGEAAATVEVKSFASRYINSDYAGRLRILGEVEELPGELAIALSPRQTALVPVLNKVLDTLEPSELERVEQRWFAVDLQPERDLQTMLRIGFPLAGVLLVLSLATLVWNRRISAESRHRHLAEQRLIDMTHGLQTGVFQMHRNDDRKIQVDFMNRLARQWARMDKTQTLEHLVFLDFVHADDQPWVQREISRSLQSGEPFRQVFRFDYPDNVQGWMLAEASCRVDERGRQLWSGYLFDMTSERALNDNLNSVLMAKHSFITTAGHELRTPVQNMMLAIESLETRDIPVEQRRKLMVAAESAEHLGELIDDLLDMSRMDARELTLAPRPTGLEALSLALGRSFSESLRRKSLGYECEIDPCLPAWVQCDPVRLRQVLHNLVGNAIKYTDSGKISLHVDAVAAPSQDEKLLHRANSSGPERAGIQWVRFMVGDTGAGMNEEQLNTVFEPFAVLGKASRHSTGLGLAICKRIVTAMGGQIQASSHPGTGSIFTVLLPLPVIESAEPEALPRQRLESRHEPAEERPVSNSSATERVLLVDDDRFVRAVLGSLLEASGMVIEKAQSGAQALEKLEQRQYLAIITDNHMPGLSGLELARSVRARAGSDEPIPAIIGMTGGMTDQELAEANDVFDAILYKPVNSAQVRQAIDQVLLSTA